MPKHAKKVLETIWEKEIIDVDNICRLCLGNRLLVLVFGSDGVKQELASKIEKYLSIMIKDDDDLPHKLCYHCASTLIEWHNLVMISAVTEARLQDYMHEKRARETSTSHKYIGSALAKQKIASFNSRRKAYTILKSSNSGRSNETESQLITDTDDNPFLNSTCDFYLKQSMGLMDDNVFDSIGSENDKTMSLEILSQSSRLDSDNISTIEECPSETFTDELAFKEQIGDIDITLESEKAVDTPDDSLTFQEGMSPDPSNEIMVVCYDDHVLTENFECLPLNLEQSGIEDNFTTNSTEEIIGNTDSGCKDITLKENQTSEIPVSVSLNQDISQDSLHIVVVKHEEALEGVTRDISQEINTTSNGQSHKSDGSYINDNIVIESINPDHNSLYNEDITLDDSSSFELGLHANYQCSECKLTFNFQNDCLQHTFTHMSKSNDDFLLPSLLNNETEEKDSSCCCVDADHQLIPFDTENKVNSPPNQNVCKYCNRHFQFPTDLDDHINECLGITPRTNINISLVVKEDKDTETPKTAFSCRKCGKTFTTQALLSVHERIHQGIYFLCSICGKELKSKTSLVNHISTHSNARPFKCDKCGKGFKLKNQLHLHKVVHSEERNFTCEICASGFRSAALLKQHQLSHSGVRPYKCDMCTAAFNRKGNLSIHQKKHIIGYKSPEKVRRAKAVVDGNTFQCSECDKHFTSILTLKYHMGRHNGDKYPFDCDYCDKRFVSVSSYQTHIRKHTGERPFACLQCEKTFRSAASLKQHAASLHSDKRPYECTICDKKFKRLQSLVVHKRTHTGEKNHKCPECGRAFAEKGDMRKHLRTHETTRDVRMKPSMLCNQ